MDEEKDEEKNELTAADGASAALALLHLDDIALPEPFSRDILLMHTIVHGVTHVENIHALAAGLHEGDHVKLVLEPDNPVDPWAILIRNSDDQKIGYIPANKNEVLFHLMDAGKYLYGVVTDGDIGDKANPELVWLRIFIDVYMQD